MLIPIRLTVDDDPMPMGLDREQPCFSWQLDSRQRAQKQTACRILVADNIAALMQDKGNVWDSERIESSRTSYIKYAGAPLLSSRRYCWKAAVWDSNGKGPFWSEPAWFNTGLFHASDWLASWIGAGPAAEPVLEHQDCPTVAAHEAKHGQITVNRRSLLLRREWRLRKSPIRATAYVTGLGFYELTINGRRVGRKVMSPAKTDFRKLTLYDAYDITGLIEPGMNVAGIVLGNGWYNPAKKFWDWRMQWHGSKRAILQALIEYEDGEVEYWLTDETWKTAAGPILSDCIYDGEVYDAREAMPGWDSPGFNDSSWQPSVLMSPPGGVLRHQAAPAIEIIETLRPQAMWESDPGVFVFDFGQNFSGWCRLLVQGDAGDEIRLRHAENIDAHGRLDTTTNKDAANEDVYILAGSGRPEEYEPRFTYHGFQYVEVRGFSGAPALDTLHARVIHSNNRGTGSFHCAHKGINHIQHCTLWSQRSNMMGMPTDDNQRDERLGWLADAHVTAKECMMNFDAARFYRKWLFDLKHGQNPDTGDIPHVCPRPHVDGTPCWSAGYALVAWYAYLHYGDLRFLGDHYENMRAYVKFLESKASGHILPRDRYGDWLSVTDHAIHGDPLLSSTFYYYFVAWITASSARLLGRAEEAGFYEGRAADIRGAMLDRFWDAKKKRFGNGSVCETAMALLLNLTPPEDEAAQVELLIQEIEYRRGGRLATGILGTQYVLEALNRLGRNDVAWEAVTAEGYPGFLDMTRDRTTLSERWDQKGTNNHVMFGSVSHWFYTALAGIRLVPDAPGFACVRIAPYMPPALAWAAGAIETVRGRLASRWLRNGEHIEFNVEIPAGVEAEIFVPCRAAREEVLEGGSLVWRNGFKPGVDGIIGACEAKDRVVFRTGSGVYEFVTRPINCAE